MSKVKSTELKVHLGKHLRDVRAGREIIVTDRDVPVARLVPYTTSPRQAPSHLAEPSVNGAPPLGRVVIKGVEVKGLDSTAMLRDDRDRR